MVSKSSTLRAFTKWVAALVATALVAAVGGALLSPTLSDYFAIGAPDIRYTYDQLPEPERFRVLDRFIDANGNAVFLASVRLRVKNIAVKQGYIDKVEFVPFTVQNLPKIEVQGVDKRDIRWGEVQVVEVRALLTVAARELTAFELEVKLFDNTGHQVGRYVDGLLARMRLRGMAPRWWASGVTPSRGRAPQPRWPRHPPARAARSRA